MQSLAGRLLILFLVVLVLVTGMRVFRAWRNDPYLNIAAGSLVALGADLGNGVFYRPIFSPDGSYGGTRYLPLYWTTIGLLMKLGVPAIAAGYAVSFLSALLLLAGVYFLLRELGVGMALSVCGPLVFLSSEALQYLVITIRSDALATGWGIWGIFFCLAGTRKRWYFVAAPVCFALAFAAKATAEFGLGAALISLFLAGKKWEAGKILGATIGGFLVVLGVMYMGSAGRALAVIRECASAGYPPLGPLRGAELFFRTSWNHDQAGFLLLLLALATLVSSPARTWKETPVVLFLVSLCGTVFIFSYLSQDMNHLLDLDAASVVLVVSALANVGAREDVRSSSDQQLKFRLALLAFVVAISVGWMLNKLHTTEKHPRRRDRSEVLRRLEQVRGTVLAEDPLLPVLMHQKAYVLDPFLFGVLRRKDPGFANPLLKKIREHEFGAIVLIHDPRTSEGRELVSSVTFGDDFLKEIDQYYFLSAQAGENLIYLPRN